MHQGEPGVDDKTKAAMGAPGRSAVIYGGALIGGFLVFLAGCILVTPVAGIAGWIVFAAVVIWQGRQGPRQRRRRGSR